MILGIDPSFTSTGVCLTTDNLSIVKMGRLSSDNSVYESILSTHRGCKVLVTKLNSFLEGYDNIHVICEYPALATRSGSYLGVLNGYLQKFFEENSSVIDVIWIPPTACNSYTNNRTKTKTHLVNFCLSNGWIQKRVQQDICTALIFTHLYQAIKENKYKNSYFIYTNETKGV